MCTYKQTKERWLVSMEAQTRCMYSIHSALDIIIGVPGDGWAVPSTGVYEPESHPSKKKGISFRGAGVGGGRGRAEGGGEGVWYT